MTETDVNELPQSEISTENLTRNNDENSCQTKSPQLSKCLCTLAEKEFFDDQNIAEENFTLREGDKSAARRSCQMSSKLTNLSDTSLTSHIFESDVKFDMNLLKEMTYIPSLLSPMSSSSGT